MGSVNLGSKYTHRVTLRLNDEQYDFLINISKMLDVSPSDYVRMSINAGMIASQKASGESINITKGMVGTDEDVKTNINNII